MTTIIFSSVGLYYKYSYWSNYVFIQIHYCVRYLMYTYPMKKICFFFFYVFVKQLRKINTNVGNHQNITLHLKSLDMSHPCISHLTICSIYHYYYYYYLFFIVVVVAAAVVVVNNDDDCGGDNDDDSNDDDDNNNLPICYSGC